MGLPPGGHLEVLDIVGGQKAPQPGLQGALLDEGPHVRQMGDLPPGLVPDRPPAQLQKGFDEDIRRRPEAPDTDFQPTIRSHPALKASFTRDQKPFFPSSI